MNQPKTKPLAAAVAPNPKSPYTAAQRGKDKVVNGAEANSLEALDRRTTEGFNLIHGRLDVIQEDVRENRRDIKGLRKELWDGLREAAVDRAQLASKADLERFAESAEADRRRIETEAAAQRAQLASKADLERLAEDAAADRHRIETEAAAQRAQLAPRVDLEKVAENAAADRRRIETEAAADRRRIETEAAADRRRIETEAAADRRRIENKLDAALAAFRAEMNERFAAQESSQRELIAMVSTLVERTEAATWTHRRLWVAVAAGTSLLVIGAVMRPLLERAVAALLGG